MALKRPGTSLEKVSTLDAEARARLAEWHITSAEELLGALSSSASQIGSLLGLDQAELERLRREAEDALDAAVLEAFADQEGKSYPVGGLGDASELAKRSSH